MLAMQSVAKSFGGREIIHDVSLKVDRGEVVGLLGPNGAGKTTTFRLLTGMFRPDRGGITLDGFDITTMPFYDRARHGVTYLPQDPFIIRGLTVEQNIQLVLETREKSSSARRQILESLLKEFGIAEARKTIAARLSGGQRRRVEIALMLACNPSFILLDEPFAGIDPIAVHDLHAIIRYLGERGVGVLITDHKARELLALVDRSYVIFEGRVLAHGDADVLMADANVRQIYLGEEFRL
jgi:lipopolysaccharide export system ATP-binding protein